MSKIGQFIFVLSSLFIGSLNLAHAMEGEEEARKETRLEINDSNNDSEQQEEIVVDNTVARKIVNALLDAPFDAWDLVQDALDALGTPKGATIIACTYGITQGISNFLWAFNWQKHAGANESTHATIQEIGGLTAAAECLLMGALVPVMLYKYNKHVQKSLAQAAQKF